MLKKSKIRHREIAPESTGSRYGSAPVNPFKSINMADNMKTFVYLSAIVIYLVCGATVEETGFRDPAWLLTPIGQACFYTSLWTPTVGMSLIGPIDFYANNPKLRIAVTRKVRDMLTL